MHLRSFRPDDLPTLHAIDQACFPPGISYTRWELAGFIGRHNSLTWVAEAAGAIAGFLVAHREPRDILHIVTIDVLEKWRRQRVGSQLMEAAERWARRRHLRLISLETAEHNYPAHAFYVARGYQKVREIKGYYADGATAWVLIKELSRSAAAGPAPQNT